MLRADDRVIAPVRSVGANICKRLLNMQFIGGFSLLFVAVALALALLGVTWLDASSKASALHSLTPKADFQLRLTAAGKKWRAERNFWISVLAFTLWVMLVQFTKLVQRVDDLEASKRSLETSAAKSKKED